MSLRSGGLGMDSTLLGLIQCCVACSPGWPETLLCHPLTAETTLGLLAPEESPSPAHYWLKLWLFGIPKKVHPVISRPHCST